MPRKPKLSLTLEPEQVAWLQAAAAKASASLSTIARQAIRVAMEREQNATHERARAV